ncbi:MAG: toll/interleukin-1 receptor domain-containing protein [Chitinophagales bacterium]|nr:toll/interleukin-1 receptor domain-containing protein [Chitinophagales bacterium]
MTYNIYIKTHSTTYNIFNIDRTDLEIIIESYNKGKDDFFIGGKKYWLSKLFEISIFSFNHPEKIDDFIKLATANDLFQRGFFGDPYLTPQILREGGDDVTRNFIKGAYGYLVDSKENKNLNIDMDIFISHSSSDIDIAKLLIEIIRKAFNTPSEKIRCTSVPGYKLKAGTNTDEQIKKEIFSSKAFIGLITKDSINSTYVLFELGARWGIDLPLIPLICDKLGVDLLNGPIKNINALSALDSSDMLQFLNDLGDILKLKPENPSGYIEDISKLANLILGSEKIESKNHVTDSSIEYSDSDEIIIQQSEIEWPDDYSMKLHYIQEQKKAVINLKNGKPTDITEIEFSRIRDRAKKEWPLDFEMRYHVEQEQIESLRKLKEI